MPTPYPKSPPSPHTIGILLETILKNKLSFMGRHFLQLVDTAMGTKAVPPFHGLPQRNHLGSLYLGNSLLEKTHRHLSDLPWHYQPTPISTGLDEPFLPHNQVDLLTLQITNILLRHEYLLAGHKLSTTLYKKPTNCATLLHFHPNDSLKCKESIVFSQALKYNILIVDNLVQEELDSLTISLLPRQYPLEIIIHIISKPFFHSSATLLYKPLRV